MKPRFTTSGILKRAGVKPTKPQTKAKASRAELIRALKIAEHGMLLMQGLTFYDDATERSRQLKNHAKVDFSMELDAIRKVLGK